MFSRYMIVSDLDGTFLHKGRTVPRNVAAIQQFTQNGGVFTIATGRLAETVLHAIPDPAALCNAPAVLCNGAYLYDYSRGEASLQDFIPAALAEEVLAFAAAHCPEVPYRVSTPKGLRAAAVEGFVANDVAAYDPDLVEVAPTAQWPRNDWYKLVFRDLPEKLEEVRLLFEKHLAGRGLAAVKSGLHFLEILPECSNKANGIKKLLSVGDYEKRTVIACGDFENDIEMLRAADVALCPANALPAVQAVCDRVLSSCEEGFMADVVALLASGELKTE